MYTLYTVLQYSLTSQYIQYIYIYHRRIYIYIYIYIYPIYNVYHHYIYRIICIIQYYMYHHYIFSILYVLALHIQYHMHHHYLLNILYVSWHVYIYVQYIICIIIIYSIYYMCNHYICSIIIWCIIMNFRYKLGTFWNREHCMILTASFRPLRNAMQVCLAGGRNAASPRNVVLPSLSHFKKNNLEHIQIHNIYIYIYILGILIFLIMIYYPDAPCMEYLPTIGPILGHM